MIGCLAAKIAKSKERTTKFQFLKMTMTTNFDEETHKYTIDGIEYPSVTEICEPISFKRLDALSKSLLDRAKQRGTEVHELCETYALTGEVDDEIKESPYLPYIASFVEWYKTYRPKVIYTEKALFSAKLGYCGKCDLVCEIDGKIFLIDYKATSAIDKKSLSVQLVGYKNLLAEYGINTECEYVLHLKKDGYVFKPIKLDYEWFDILLKHNKKLKEKYNGK